MNPVIILKDILDSYTTSIIYLIGFISLLLKLKVVKQQLFEDFIFTSQAEWKKLCGCSRNDCGGDLTELLRTTRHVLTQLLRMMMATNNNLLHFLSVVSIHLITCREELHCKTIFPNFLSSTVWKALALFIKPTNSIPNWANDWRNKSLQVSFAWVLSPPRSMGEQS